MEKIQSKLSILETFFIVVFLLSIGSALIISPFYGDINVIDEGQFAAWTNHMLHGKKMYADIYITYGPLYVYPLYLLFKFLSPSLFLVRLLYTVFSAFLGIYIVKKCIEYIRFSLFYKWITLFLLLFIPGINIRQGLGFLVIYYFTRFLSERKYRLGLLGSFFTCIAFLVSPEIGLFCFILWIFVVCFTTVVQKNFTKPVFFLFIGIVIPILVFMTWSYKEGWLLSYIETTTDVFTTFSGISLPNGKGLQLQFLFFKSNIQSNLIKEVLSKDMLLYWSLVFYVIPFLYLCRKVILHSFKKEEGLLFLTMLYGMFQYYLLIGRSGNFYFALTPLILIYVYFLQILHRMFTKTNSKEKTFIGVFICIILLFIFRIIFIFRTSWVNIMHIPSSFSIYKQNPLRVGPMTISSQQKDYVLQLQKFINKKTTSKDYVFFFSNEPLFYMLTDRVNPTRFDLPYIATTKEKRLKLLNELRENPPKYIFENTSAWSIDEVSNKTRLPEIWSFINESYVKIPSSISFVNIYTLK